LPPFALTIAAVSCVAKRFCAFERARLIQQADGHRRRHARCVVADWCEVMSGLTANEIAGVVIVVFLLAMVLELLDPQQ